MSGVPKLPRPHPSNLLPSLLAALNIVTVLAGLALSRTLLSAHEESLALNQDWVRRLERSEELGLVIARLNAPGNDVFDSKNPAHETARLDADLIAFDLRLERMRDEIAGIPAEAERERLRADVEQLAEAVHSMVGDARAIFADFGKGRPAEAARRMAVMDRKYSAITHLMAEIRTHLREFQRAGLTAQKDKATDMNVVEYAVALAVAALVGLITVYRSRLVRRMEEAENLIEEQRTKMQSAAKMAALGEMAGGVAHEINTPLATISMRAEQLKEILEEEDVDKAFVVETLDVIEKTSARIAKIIRGMRTFARDGESDPFEQASVRAIIEDTFAFCGEKLKHRGVDLRIEASDPDPRIECRATQISQVLMNLIGNAADAVEDTPRPWIRVDVVDHGDRVAIEVSDNGAGVPPALREKIMQPFFTTKDVGKGTGLGLSISQGIVRAHGGALVLDSGSGPTRFVVSLPKAPPAATARPAA